MVKYKKTKRLILEVAEQIGRDYRPRKIILYGSYASGKPTDDSDIDLFIVKDTDKRRVDRFVEVSRLIDGLECPVSVSPLVYTPREVEERLALGDGFVEEVLSSGEVIYGE